MKVGILANPHKPDSIPTVKALRDALKARGVDSVMDSETAAMVNNGPAPAWAGKLKPTGNMNEVMQGVDIKPDTDDSSRVVVRIAKFGANFFQSTWLPLVRVCVGGG